MTVNSLAGTSVSQINIDLAASGGAGDGAADVVVISGTAGADTFDVAANGAAMEITGLGPLVRVLNAELANDRIVTTGAGGDRVNVNGTSGADTMQLVSATPYVRTTVSGFSMPVDVNGALTLSVNGLGGPDTITAFNGLAALGIPIILDGGEGDDTITGSDAAETIFGGAGNDVVSGGTGNDVVFLGEGNDTYTWNPGNGSDTVEGEGGSDTLVFNGANISEQISFSANGSRLMLTRDVGSVVMDVNGIETVNLQALGGADTVTVNSLTGTSVTQINVDLAASGGVGDLAADTVIVNGTANPDTINVSAFGGVVQVNGLTPQVQIAHPEASNDTLVVNGLAGTDTINVGAGVTSLIKVTVNQ